jgi:hypothetical protein
MNLYETEKERVRDRDRVKERGCVINAVKERGE